MKRTKVIIIGAGGHSAELDDYLHYSNQLEDQKYELIGFLDDDPTAYDKYTFSAPFLGSIKDHIVRSDCQYMMGIANLKYRKKLIEEFVDRDAQFLTYIHPSAFISRSSKIGEGVVIAPNVNVGPNVVVGDYTLLNSRCSIGHDTILGKFNFITPNVCFSGFTKVGDENLFGINSATIPNITIGSNNTIAAGMTINKNIKDGETVIYRFREKLTIVKK